MIQTLRYIDEKSDKFWRVETCGCEMMTNWGKTGTAGHYEVKELDTEDNCEKQALKLVVAKQKKGYSDMPEFDAEQHFYFDTDEYGPHFLTSHPIFRKYFSDDLYYDCADEEAPFGSDEGSDTFHVLQENFRRRSKINCADFPQLLIERDWNLTYFPPEQEQMDAELIEQATQTYNTLPGDQEILQTDQVILATAFGQIKIAGNLDTALQELAFRSLERMERLYRLLWNWEKEEPPYNIVIMRRDLSKFANRKL